MGEASQLGGLMARRTDGIVSVYDRVDALLADNDPGAAEAILTTQLAETPADARALLLLGKILMDSGRVQAAIKTLDSAVAQQPKDPAALLALAWALKADGKFHDARERFAAAGEYAEDIQGWSGGFHAAGWCSLMLRQPAAALGYYIRAGILPPTAENFLTKPDSVSPAQIEQLSDTAAEMLLEVLHMAGQFASAERVGYMLIAREDNIKTKKALSTTLPSVLRAQGKLEEGGALYMRILAAGGYAADYRCSWPNQQLWRANQPWAAAFYAADRRRFEKRAGRALTLEGDLVSNTGAVLVAEFSSHAAGARYRFEYGTDPQALDSATPWRPLPPPRTGKLRELAHRQCEWSPQSTLMSWERRTPDHPSDERPVMRLTGPFSTDRNQLNGIGAHEMLISFGWCYEPLMPMPDTQLCLRLDGGIPDIRDAEFMFTVRGEAFEHRSSSLTFWVGRDGPDPKDYFCSQWALTGTVFPDAALESGRWTKVSLTLPSEPRQWTYTGNNPDEQGVRASRYSRLPLDVTLRRQNHPLLLIFALDDELNPPRGHVEIADITAHFRHASLLSPEAGCRLEARPASGNDDPLNLTRGIRGFDDALWTSGSNPNPPLVFAWSLPRPVTATHLQIAQHPYWPAKDAEIWVGGFQAERMIWKGTLPEGRADQPGPSHAFVNLTGVAPFTFAELRILSGYHPERCGLDSIDIFGEGAVFRSDGLPCSASEEVDGLTAGQTIYYRAVLAEDDEMTAGEMRGVNLPADCRPVIESAMPFVRAKSPSCFKVRANAMGLATDLWAEFQLPSGEVIKTAKTALGCMPTGRHIYYIPRGLPDVAGAMFLYAGNAAGRTRFPVAWPIRA